MWIALFAVTLTVAAGLAAVAFALQGPEDYSRFRQ